MLRERLHEIYAATDGRFNRQHFFNKYPERQKLVAHMADADTISTTKC